MFVVSVCFFTISIALGLLRFIACGRLAAADIVLALFFSSATCFRFTPTRTRVHAHMALASWDLCLRHRRCCVKPTTHCSKSRVPVDLLESPAVVSSAQRYSVRQFSDIDFYLTPYNFMFFHHYSSLFHSNWLLNL